MPVSRLQRWARDRWKKRAVARTRRHRWRGTRSRGTRHPVRGGLLNVLAVAVAATAAFWVVHRTDQVTYGEGQPDHDTITPSLNPASPFAGSPAQHYANGAAGVVAPRARPIGQFSAAQVAAAYRSTRRLIIAAGLDKRTLNGGRPGAFIAALGPGQFRSFFLAHLNDGAQSTRYEVVSFAKGTMTLVGGVVKVKGQMRARPRTVDSVHGLDVSVEYLFVYAIERPGAPNTLERVVVRITGQIFYAPPSMAHPQSISQWASSPTPARCDINDGYIYPTFVNSQPDKIQPSGPAVDPYDQNAPQRSGGSCQNSSGT